MSEQDELFPPTPGGMVDTARKQAAAAAQTAPETAEDTDGPFLYAAVRTRPETPDLGAARTLVLSAVNKVLRLLPQDAQRRTAVVLAVDNDVYIATQQGTAQAVAGTTDGEGAFYLPAGIAIPIDTQATLWCACTTTETSSRVSVLITKDSQP